MCYYALAQNATIAKLRLTLNACDVLGVPVHSSNQRLEGVWIDSRITAGLMNSSYTILMVASKMEQTRRELAYIFDEHTMPKQSKTALTNIETRCARFERYAFNEPPEAGQRMVLVFDELWQRASAELSVREFEQDLEIAVILTAPASRRQSQWKC